MLHLPGPQRHLEARGSLLMRTPTRVNGQDELGVFGDQQGVELKGEVESEKERASSEYMLD